MKNIIFLLFLIPGATALASGYECAMRGMDFFPKQKEISVHSMFIVEGYGFSQETVKGFKNRKVYLESSSGERVLLKLQEILKGQMKLTQAVFSPESSLQPNTTYYLKYEDQTEGETHELQRKNSDTGEREPVSWETSGEDHSELISPDLKISFEETQTEFFGCGPAANAVFDVTEEGEEEIWYKTEFVELESNEKATFYLTTWKDRLKVGHGMCSGAFTYSREGAYKVRFTAMNIEGKSIKTTQWFTYDSPFEGTEHP